MSAKQEKIGLKITELVRDLVNEGATLTIWSDRGGNTFSIGICHDKLDPIDHTHIGDKHGEVKRLEKDFIHSLDQWLLQIREE